jgi:tRNA (mo5U34)-methyltransferase
VDAEELRARVASFERWHYPIDLGNGIVTPVHKPEKASNRVAQRRRYFFDRLLSVTGGNLKGMRVLDLGCNAGYWSLQAIEAGADFVFGIDGRKMHIDQANLVFEAKGVDPDRYQFEVGNFLHRSFGPFDLVLCLGVMYHVSSPVDLFDTMASTSAELLVIDTEVSALAGDFVHLCTESTDDYRDGISDGGDQDLVVGYPTRGAVTMLADRLGYEAVALDPGCISDFTRAHDYERGDRVAFICSRGRSLSELPREVYPEPLRGLARFRTHLGRRLLQPGT